MSLLSHHSCCSCRDCQPLQPLWPPKVVTSRCGCCSHPSCFSRCGCHSHLRHSVAVGVVAVVAVVAVVTITTVVAVMDTLVVAAVAQSCRCRCGCRRYWCCRNHPSYCSCNGRCSRRSHCNRGGSLSWPLWPPWLSCPM